MPMERDRYVSNHKELHFQKKEAANWTCEFCGRMCRKVGESWSEFFDRVGWQFAQEEKWGRYILTVAHLNQKPEDNSAENLKALCAPCHLKHDRAFKVQNAYAKRERRGQLSLLDSQPLIDVVLAGHGVDPTRIQLPFEEKSLDEIYASLPAMQCVGKCQGACGAIGIFPAEVQALSDRNISLPEIDDNLTCSKLSPFGTCSIYAQRPLICRLYGQVEKLQCEHGCKPSRWISQEEVHQLMEEIQGLQTGECYLSIEGVRLTQKKQTGKRKRA